MDEIIKQIIAWGDEKGINNPTKQFNKLAEEMLEAHEAFVDCADRTGGIFSKERHAHLVEELGDIGVVWVLLCDMLGVNPQEALEVAHNKNKDRKGKTINGNFIKEDDLRS